MNWLRSKLVSFLLAQLVGPYTVCRYGVGLRTCGLLHRMASVSESGCAHVHIKAGPFVGHP